MIPTRLPSEATTGRELILNRTINSPTSERAIVSGISMTGEDMMVPALTRFPIIPDEMPLMNEALFREPPMGLV